jgi:hypothetical protein
MKKLVVAIGVALLAVLVSPGAQALCLDLGTLTWSPGDDDNDFLYRANVDGYTPSQAEEGMKTYFQTSFFINAADPKDYAKIELESLSAFPPLTFVYMKSGGGTAVWDLVTLGVDLSGVDCLIVPNVDFNPGQEGPIQAISHVTVDGERVPDGGTTLALLGVGMLGLGAMRRLRD